MQIFRVPICLLSAVICVIYIPNDVTGPSEARDLLFLTSNVPYPRSISAVFSEPSRVGLFSSLPQSPDSTAPPRPTAPSGKHPVERGYAAFYSPSLEGHKTACGGVYSSSALTAAHRSLPCGTKLRVTNLRNGKSVRVTVNDHGPTSRDRIIDLSYAAAQALDFIPQGTTLVKVEILR